MYYLPVPERGPGNVNTRTPTPHHMDQAEWTAERQIADMHLLTQMLMNQISQHAYDTQGNFEVIRDSNDARSSVSGDLSKANQVITDLNKDLNARDEATDQERQARNKERETLITEIQGLKVEVKTLEGRGRDTSKVLKGIK